MRLLSSILVIIYVLHSTSARCKRPRPSPVMGALQNILSPANAERTMQMLKTATQQTIGNTVGPCNLPLQPPVPVKYSPTILPLPEPCNPINAQISIPNFLPNPNTLVMPNLIPNQVPVQLPHPIPLQVPSPLQVQSPNPFSFQMPSQIPLQLPSPPLQLPLQLQNPPLQLPVQLSNPPLQWPVQLPSPAVQMPCSQLQLPSPQLQVPSPQLQLPSPQLQLPSPQLQLPSPQLPLPNPPFQLPSPPLQLPCQVPEVSAPLAPIPIPEIILEVPPCVREREIIYPFSDISNTICSSSIGPISENNLPVALTSAQDIYTCPLPSPTALFNLPAASPGSSCAQDTTAGTRSQYLRKIPIPPPTL